MARRLGSAMISKADCMPLVCSTEHIRVKAYKTQRPRQQVQPTCGDEYRRLLQRGVLKKMSLHTSSASLRQLFPAAAFGGAYFSC